ncbi:DNA-binding cell septation regulator SpoVG [Hydrogenivirga caldilitoris]|uniref:DNA-binding cell septation regulator SpoVG n=1 Tax=Hydrogenivirga caldilitoris TaxID=246264 RepID=A0A497XPB8_9AQUI|nr:septation protein SpoVG family protein [Hydrogenivirga caldilitoris]RLJ70718.1 DNA-binding cell septation regulator SpoVG [Hydrogenivirga caldilitoris]
MVKVEVIKFYPFELPGKRGGLVGYADVKIGELIVIKTVKLMKNRYGGYYVQMPSVQLGDRSYEVVEVISKELLEEIRRKVREIYEERFKI